jgi:tetratricopeptide (TPR) repeat protein
MKSSLFLVVFFFCFVAIGQQDTDQQLAQHYYSSGEWEKAKMYYAKLFDKNPSKFNFKRYYECLVQTNEKSEAEKVLKRQVNKFKQDVDYQFMLGQFYQDNEQPAKAEKHYESLIQKMPPDPNAILALYTGFRTLPNLDRAFQTVEKGRKLLKNTYSFHQEFAELYGLTGQQEKKIREYLDWLDAQPSEVQEIQNILSRQIDFTSGDNTDFSLLKKGLLERIQKQPNEIVYPEMLIWLFLQNRNFSGALLQTQALDKRFNEQGKRVVELGKICLENKEYETARKAFKYVTLLGEDKLFYASAESALLHTRFLEVTTQRNYAAAEIEETLQEYQNSIQKMGKKRTNVDLIREMCHIQAFYSNDSDKAIQTLEETMAIPGITDIQRAELKMLLADIHVLHADIWEAALYYMQVEKDFKFEPIGHEAKYKNARVFYYDGEFDYAQAQLSVLKESTSKLIANDAMKLSLLITDNFGIDSNYRAMTWFSNAELYLEQHKYTEAFTLFDSIISVFPYHSLGDEILLAKAKAMESKGDWDKAILFLEELLKYHAEDILADDALFHLGDIYENIKKDTEKANEYFKRILFEFKGSLYAEEARKRIRNSRGDTTDF